MTAYRSILRDRDDQSQGIKDFVYTHVESNIGYAVSILAKLRSIPEVHTVVPSIENLDAILWVEDPDTGDHLEMCEFYIVSNYLYRLLKDRREPVTELLGMKIWGRQTSGQAIYMDSVIQDIWYDLN